MKSILVHNFIEKSDYYPDYKIYYVYEFKSDIIIYGKDYCIEKYGEIYYIHTISDFTYVDIVDLYCSNMYTDDKNTSKLIGVDDDYETDDIYKLFNMIVYNSPKLSHKVVSKSVQCDKYFEFMNVEIYDILHVMDMFELNDFIKFVKFNHSSRKDIYYRYKIYLYNYNRKFSSILSDIYDNEIDEDTMKEFNIQFISPDILI